MSATSTITTTHDLAHAHREHLESFYTTLRLMEREDVRAMARENADRAAWLATLLQKARTSAYPWPRGRRASTSMEGLAARLVLEERYAEAIGAWSDRVFDSLDLDAAYAAATWTRKSRGAARRLAHTILKRDPNAIYLPDTALPQTVASLLDDYRDAPPQMKPIVAAQIAATTGGLTPQQASTALMNTLQEFTAPTRQSVAEGLTGGLSNAEMWAANGVQAYLQMAMQTSQVSGQTALQHMGINKTFAWANPANTARDMFSVRGSKVIQGLYGEHVRELTTIITEATAPRAPLTIQQVEQRIRERWPKLKKWQVTRVARTETAAVWSATSMNTYAANGVSHWESTIAHGPSIGIDNSAPCPLCVELAGDIELVGAGGDLPPYHSNCRCEIVPILEDPDTGEPWLPPDEPWTGGGDIPVCGTVAAVKARRQRDRLEGMRYVRVKKNVACLTPAPPPGEPYGGVNYNKLSVAHMDDALYAEQLAALRAQIEKEWALGNTAEIAANTIKNVPTNTFNSLWVARDAQGVPLSIAHVAEGEGVLVVERIVSRAGGSRHTVKRLAADAYSKGWDILMREGSMTPQLRKVLQEWGFKPPVPGSVTLRLKHGNIPEEWLVKKPPAPPEPTPAPVESVPASPIFPEPLAEISDDISAQLYSTNNKIAGWKKKLKQQHLKGADVDDIAATEAKILELQATQADLKTKLKGAPTKPKIEQPTPGPKPEPLLVEPVAPPPKVKLTEVEGDMLAGDAAKRQLDDGTREWGARMDTSSEEWQALDTYVNAGAGQRVNDLLRSGMKERDFKFERIEIRTPSGLSRTFAGRFRDRLSTIIDGTPQMERGMVMWGEVPKEGIKVGKTYTEKGFLEGATEPPTRIVGDAYREEMFVEIHVSPGMKGVWGPSVPGIDGRAYVMPRGLKLKIKRIEERIIEGQKRRVAVAEVTNGPRPPLKPHEIHVTPPNELAVVPGGVTKEKGTTALLKKLEEGLRSGRSELKKDIMQRLTKAVHGKPGWDPASVNDAFRFSGTRFSSDPDENVMASLIHNWAITSSDADARGVAIQIAAKEELGLDVQVFAASYWNDPVKNAAVIEEAERLLAQPGVRSTLRMFVRAQYEETQRYLNSIGVDEITVYRGMRVSSSEAPWGPGISTLDVADNPLASWSVKHSISRRFYGGTMLRSVVPREMVLGTPITGFGCASEYELVVLNAGRNSAWVSQTGTLRMTEAELVAARKEVDEIARNIKDLTDRQTPLKVKITEMEATFSSFAERHQNTDYLKMVKEYTARRADIYNLSSRVGHLNQSINQGGTYWNYRKETELRGAIKEKLEANPSLAGETRPKPQPVPRAPRPKPEPSIPGTVTLAQARNRVKNLTYKLYVERRKVPVDEAKVAQIEGALTDAKDLVAGMTTKSRVPRPVIRLR